jgi:hypothetical protein
LPHYHFVAFAMNHNFIANSSTADYAIWSDHSLLTGDGSSANYAIWSNLFHNAVDGDVASRRCPIHRRS